MSNWDILHVDSLEVEDSVTEPYIRSALEDGRLTQDDCVRRVGKEQWQRIYSVSEFRVVSTERPSPGNRERRRSRASVVPKGLSSSTSRITDLMLFRFQRHVPELEVDMAPAATLALLLVLFFVVASTVVLQKVLKFPAQSNSGLNDAPMMQRLEDLQDENIIVKISADNTILVDGQPTEEHDLVVTLTRLRRERAVTDLVIRPDDRSYHQTLVAVVDAGKMANMSNIKLASRTSRRLEESAKDSGKKS